MSSDERFVDTMLREELRKLNAHLPKERRLINELLRENTPSVPTIEGGRIVMRREDLEEMSKSLAEDVRARVKLPLVLLRRTELGPGAFVLLGDKAEECALSNLLGTFAGNYEDFKKQSAAATVFYKPQISELLRRFHSLVIIGFGPPSDLTG